MSSDQYEQIKNNPDFHTLVAKRSRFAWSLSAILLAIYFSFILTIAFKPELLGQTLREGGVITWSIPVGIFIIISAIVLTGIYVRKANKDFDPMIKKITEKAKS